MFDNMDECRIKYKNACRKKFKLKKDDILAMVKIKCKGFKVLKILKIIIGENQPVDKLENLKITSAIIV